MIKIRAGIVVFALLILGCQTEDRPQEAVGVTPNIPRFDLLGSSFTGVDFQNKLPENRYLNILAYQYYYNGGGVAIGDINNDSLPDIFFSGNITPNQLYLNRGDLRFENITESAGLNENLQNSWRTGVSMADVNADGLLDIYICRSGNLQPENRTNLLYINNGDLTFTEEAAKYGLDDAGYSIQSAFFDYDGDGDLDMYLTNHGMNYYGRDQARITGSNNFYAEDRLYRNNKGKFIDVTSSAGLLKHGYSYGLGLGIGDLNNDNLDDIYVSNDFYEKDYLYFNQGNGTFSQAIESATGHTSFFGMGNDLADYNNDGLLDIVEVDMAPGDHYRRLTNLEGISYHKFQEFIDKGYHYQYMYNSLQLNRGGKLFSNLAFLAGMAATDWSWAPLLADFDNDGRKELFITNGLRKDVLNLDFVRSVNTEYQIDNPEQNLSDEQFREILSRMPSQKLSNFMFDNQGEYGFTDVAGNWGMNQPSFSNGAAWGDLDNDGDLDLVVNNIDQEAFIYRNNSERITDSNFLKLKFKGSAQNPFAYGTKVWIHLGDSLMFQQLYPVRGYQSSVEPMMIFGLGSLSQVDRVEVRWPDGKFSQLDEVQSNQTIVLDHAEAEEKAAPVSEKKEAQLFTAMPQNVIPARHQENEYRDFYYQVLLPHKLSEEGPALAAADVNGDGLDDLYLGGASGYAGKLLLQGKNGFRESQTQVWAQDRHAEDVAALFFDADGDQDQDLYVVSGGSEFNENDPMLQDRLYFNDGKGNFEKQPQALPVFLVSGGCVVAEDYDRDNDLDLFVGGRQVPGSYPLPPRSIILQNQGGRFTDVTSEVAPGLEKIGMVTAAIWEDLNGDDLPELVLAGEWMPVTWFSWNNGSYQNQTEALNLQETSGWYKSLVAADLDQDGDLDLVAGNQGLNHRYPVSEETPFHLYAADFDGNGNIDPVLAYNYRGNLVPWEGRTKMNDQMPGIYRKYLDYNSYARSSLAEILGQEKLDQSLHLQTRNFASVWLENQDGRLIVHELPAEVQFSPVYAILAADFNQDRQQDLLLAGNQFGTEHMTPRQDASLGLYLQGTGSGKFQAVNHQESGFLAPGEVRKMVQIRIPDGVAVVVANNNRPLQIFRLNLARRMQDLSIR